MKPDELDLYLETHRMASIRSDAAHPVKDRNKMFKKLRFASCDFSLFRGVFC